MGSPKVSNAKPQLPMETKPIKNFFKNIFGKKTDKNKFQKERIKDEQTKPNKVIHRNEDDERVANILKRFENFDNEVKEDKKDDKDSSEDDFSQFKFKIIEDDRKRHSSEDSGYSETKEEYSKEDLEVIDSLRKLELDEQKDEKKEEEKDKKTKQVVLSRGPVRNKLSGYNVDPYASRQVNQQINQQALCGGQVFVATPDNYGEFEQALQNMQQVQEISQTTDQFTYWEDLQEVIQRDTQTPRQMRTDFPLPENSQQTEELLNTLSAVDFIQELNEFVENHNIPNINIETVAPSNDIEEFDASHNLPNDEITTDISNTLLGFDAASNNVDANMKYIFPTPPRSETVPSPMSESLSIYPPSSNWENSLSPDRSSPLYHSDYELYQEISFESPISEDEKRRNNVSLSRTNSISRTLKNYKDMQKDIANEFSKKDCCLINRKTCKELFDEHMCRLQKANRKELCFQVAKMDIKGAYGVLQQILRKAASGSDQVDLQVALFALVCQRVLTQSPDLFTQDFGLSVLKSAVMRCPHLPILTRFVVSAIYTALRQNNLAATPDCVFDEVDALGDNLIIACARGGDAYALVLSEITRAEARGDLPPLFRIHHANTDGYTALHVACSLHSTSSPRLHSIHVLMEHAAADLWKGDVKGGDTALHLAVNSANCDLNVVLLLFKYIDRSMWKKLAFCHNMSSVTPLEYARSATKSTTRQNYPPDVLNFLKKCR